MTIIENELRDLLRERGDDLPARVTSAPGRLDGVRGRIVRRRRRRTAGGALVAALAVAVGGLGWAGELGRVLPHRHDSLPALPSPMPEYVGGGRLLAALRTDRGRVTSVTLPFTVPDGKIMFRTSCEGAGQPPQLEFVVSGHVFGEVTCDGGMTSATSEVAAAGLKAGDDATLTVKRKASVACQGCTPAGDVSLSVGVYRIVPRAEYHFPARPASVTPPDTVAQRRAKGWTVAGVDGAQATAGRASFPMRVEGQDLVLEATAPGVLTVQVDGVTVGTGEFWDYTDAQTGVTISAEALKAAGVHVEPRQEVTVTVVATEFQDPAWTAWTEPGSAADALPVSSADPRS